MALSLKETPTSTLGYLDKLNKHTPNDIFYCSDIKCGKLNCTVCPFSVLEETVTLGDVRKELATRVPTTTESHKGGGGLTSPFRANIKVDLTDLSDSPNEPQLECMDAQPIDHIDQAVYNPKHYSVLDDIEAIILIARSMSTEQFKGYCLGNIIKYRMRLGGKDSVEQDLKKAQNYKDIFEKHKGLCYDYSE